ncbi:MAG: type I restriction enzyme HsdR N-terminal domain-containing protein [Desulfobacteraceae bacterium]|nr:type I restriction enzyme HsdR N-terminal domain-containing protein [Desulfobacteraceae bacterium]
MDSNPHHVVMGELTDFLTGKLLTDTHDERYRQQIARFLVNGKRFKKERLKNNVQIKVAADKKKAVLKVDFLISCNDKIGMIIKYAPGSLVTRRLLTVALSRIIKSYQIPVAVVTNGEDAEIINGQDGKLMGTGMDAFPDKVKLESICQKASFKTISKDQFEKASRIVYAFEVDGACPCDTGICKIE